MNSTLLVLHVVGSIVLVGPITLATSLFPKYAAVGPQPPGNAVSPTNAIAVLLHRVTRVYGALGLLVPALGFALAARMEILNDAWIIASMILTAVAAALLALVITPLQRDSFDEALTAHRVFRLRLASGLFALLWAIVVALMILRPGASA